MSNDTDRLTVTCTCKVCKINAAKIGATFPLTATLPARFSGLVVTKGRTANHGLVYDAHNPGAIGAAMCARLDLRPVA